MTSSRPRSRMTRATSASTSAAAVTSHPSPAASRPAAQSSAATRSQRPRSRLARNTAAPSSAKASAMVRPRCVPPPVTIATRPLRSKSVCTRMPPNIQARGRDLRKVVSCDHLAVPPTRVAVIGTGYMGERHARIYARLPDVELVAICDPREAPARALSTETGAAVYADWGALLRRDDLDAVSVCTPDGLHREPCELAARAGLHILVE